MKIFKILPFILMVSCNEEELTSEVKRDPSLFFPKIEIIREERKPCNSPNLSDLIEANCEMTSILKRMETEGDLEAWIQTPNLNGEMPVFLAVKNKQLRLLKKLVELGADINPIDKLGKEKEVPAFALALSLENEKVIRFFLKENNEFIYRLFKSSNEYELSLILKFLKEGAIKPDMVRDGGIKSTAYPLLWLSQIDLFGITQEEEELMTDIAEFLIAHGSWVNRGDDHDLKQRTPLYFSIIKNNLSLFRALKNSAKVNLKFEDDQGRGALHLAAKYNSLSVLNELMNLGLPLSFADDNGNTPLLHSIIEGHFEIFKRLNKNSSLEYLNIIDRWGESLLHKCTYYGRPLMVQFLMDRKIDPNPLNRLGQTPLDIAAKGLLNFPGKRKEYLKIVDILKKYGGIYRGGSN